MSSWRSSTCLSSEADNDRIIRLSANLDLPQIYRREPERLHTASDGQKFAVRRASLNANHSFKYFGKGQGVSAYAKQHELYRALKAFGQIVKTLFVLRYIDEIDLR